MAKPLQKERENRSAEKKDLSFHPYNITPESAHTSILLLESAESEILCQVNFATHKNNTRHKLICLAMLELAQIFTKLDKKII